MTKHDAKVKALAVQMYADGARVEDILATIGCARTTLINWVRNSGRKSRSPGRPRTYASERERLEAKAAKLLQQAQSSEASA